MFAVGRPTVAIRMLTEDLLRDDPAVIVPLTRESVQGEGLPDEALRIRGPGISIIHSVGLDEPAE